MNFPIQGMVASALDRAVAYLHDIIQQQGLQDDIRLLLTIHDSLLVEARHHLIPHAIALIKWAMTDMVPIYPTNLSGEPTGTGPFHLGTDISVSHHWSEAWSYEDAVRLGIPTEFAGKSLA
jgi:DNA polymerase I-like protein with 3'-5' exonuclease and polymerase domains